MMKNYRSCQVLHSPNCIIVPHFISKQASVRTEKDTLGEVQVPADKYYGSQTVRSIKNFPIGVETERMPVSIHSILKDFVSFFARLTCTKTIIKSPYI